MKKTLAILISAILVVAAVCAFALTSGAAAATTVKVSVDGGAEIELNATTTTATHAGTGTFTFNASTGTLTLDNFKGNATFSNPNGDLTVKLVGTNEITTTGRVFDLNNEGSYIFTSDSTANSLVATGKDFVFQAGSGGKFVFQDKAKVTINATAKDPIHFGGNGKGMTVKGDADVTVACSAANVRFIGANASAQDAVLLIEDNAKLTLNPTIKSVLNASGQETGNWQTPINVWQMKMTGGTLTINNTANEKLQTLLGIKLGFDNVQAEQTKGEFLGGKIVLNFKTSWTTTTAGANARVYGIYGMNANKMTFKNMDIVYNVEVPDSYRNAADYTGTNTWTGISGVISNQNKGTGITTKNDVEIDGCTFTINAPNTTCAFSRETGTFTMANTKVKGQSGTAFKNGNFLVDFDTCDFSEFTASEAFVGSAWTNVIPTNGDYSYQPLAASVVITDAANKTYTLCKEAPTLTAEQATAIGIPADTFKYAAEPKYVNGDITLPVFEMKNLPKDKVAKINFSGNGSAIVNVYGVNTISGNATTHSNLFNGGAMVIVGKTADAALNVTSNTAGTGNWHFCYKRYLSAKDVAITINSENGDAMQGARSDYFTNNAGFNEFHLEGNTVFTIFARGNGFKMVGGSQELTLADNAKMIIKPVAKINGADNTVLGNGLHMCMDKDDGTGTQTQTFKMSGNAEFKVEGKGVECNRIGVERYSDSAKTQVKASTKVNTTFELSGNAKFDVEGNGQALYLYSGGVGTVTTFVVKDNASFKSVANDRPETHKEFNIGNYQSGLQFNALKVDVDILGGSFYVEGERNGWNYGAIAFNQNPTDVDIFVKDAKFDVVSRNNTKAEYLKNANDTTPTKVENNHINNAIIIPSSAADATITFAGKAVATLTANNDTQQNRAHGLWLQANQKLILQDEAVLNATAGGTATAYTGAGIHSKGCDILVKDKATLNASVTGTATSALTLEGDATLTVQGDAKVNLDGGKTGNGINNYNGTATGSIAVKDNAVLVSVGKLALNDSKKAIKINAKTIDSGADAKTAEIDVEAPSYKEGYIKLYTGAASQGGQGGQGGSTTNPGTSDVSVAAFALVAFAAIAVSAAIVLRKKSI